MKKKKRLVEPTRKFPRPAVMIVTAIAVVAIGTVTVVSRQSANNKTTSGPQKVVTANAAEKGYVKVKVAGQDVHVDSQTGKIKPLTPEEARQLAAGLKGMLNKSTAGLVETHHDDGSISMDLKGRFQNVTVARINEDGTLSTSCVDNPRAAAAFFGIDPKLLESDEARTTPINQ